MAITRLAIAQEFYGLELDNGWVGTVNLHAEVPLRNENVTSQMSRDVFSSMVYENICPGEYEPHPSQCFLAHRDCGKVTCMQPYKFSL